MPRAVQRLLPLLAILAGLQACVLGEAAEPAEAETTTLGPDLEPDFGLGSAPDGSGPSGGHAAPGGRSAPGLQPTTFDQAADLVGQAADLVDGAARGEPRRLSTGAPPTGVHLPIGSSPITGAGRCTAPVIDPDTITIELDPDSTLEQRTFGMAPARGEVVDGCP